MAVFQLDYVRMNVLRVWEKKREKLILMTVIEIRPHRWGWKVFEAPGVELVVPEKDQAINYAGNRASFRSGEIHVLIQPAISNAPFRSRKRIENCDASGCPRFTAWLAAEGGNGPRKFCLTLLRVIEILRLRQDR
jgi:hypothetical protein